MRLEIHIHHHYHGGIMADLSKLQASIDALIAVAAELLAIVKNPPAGGVSQADIDALQAKVDAATAADAPPAV